jgi:hypothetical protein
MLIGGRSIGLCAARPARATASAEKAAASSPMARRLAPDEKQKHRDAARQNRGAGELPGKPVDLTLRLTQTNI